MRIFLILFNLALFSFRFRTSGGSQGYASEFFLFRHPSKGRAASCATCTMCSQLCGQLRNQTRGRLIFHRICTAARIPLRNRPLRAVSLTMTRKIKKEVIHMNIPNARRDQTLRLLSETLVEIYPRYSIKLFMHSRILLRLQDLNN